MILINQNTLNNFEKLSANVDPDKINIAIREAQELDLRVFMGKAFYDDFISNFSNTPGIGSLILTSKATTANAGKYASQALVGGSGTGATATFQVVAGYVMAVSIVAPGSGYQVGDILTVAALPNAIFTVGTVSQVLVISGTISTAYSQLWNGVTYTDKSGHSIIYPGIIPALAYWTLARWVEGFGFQYTSTGAVQLNHDDAQALSQKDIVMIANRNRTKANAKANDIEQFIWNNLSTYPLWRPNDKTKVSRQPGPRISEVDRTNNNRAWNNGDGNLLWPYNGGIY